MAEGGHHVPGLVEAQVTSMEEVWEVLQAGSSSRTVGSTRANDHSSRSHWYVQSSENHYVFSSNESRRRFCHVLCTGSGQTLRFK